MSKLDFRTFGGLMPKVAPQLLPDIAAQTATNVDVRRGDLRPVNTVVTSAIGGQVLRCGAAGTTTIATWAAINNASFSITMGQSVTYVARVTSFSFAGSTSMVEVAMAIRMNLYWAMATFFAGTRDRLNVYWDEDNLRFVFEGPYGTISAMDEVGGGYTVGTDISLAGYCNGRSNGTGVSIAENQHLGSVDSANGLLSIIGQWPERISIAANPMANDSYARWFFSGWGKPTQMYYPNGSTYPVLNQYPLGVESPTSIADAAAVAKGSSGEP